VRHTISDTDKYGHGDRYADCDGDFTSYTHATASP